MKKGKSMRRKPILLRSILKRKEKTIIIGVMGTHPGVGVTHTAIMLCQYLSKEKYVETAYLEMNQRNEINYLHGAKLGVENGTVVEDLFDIENITFYKNVTSERFITLYNQKYMYCILDLGSDFSQNQEEFLRCDIKILVGSLAEWKRPYTFQCIYAKRHLPGFEYWLHLIVFGQRKDMKIASSELGIRMNGIGYEPDPFLLKGENKKLFQKLLFP